MRTILCLLAAVFAMAADNPWGKVKELKSGSELRIWTRGEAKPLDAVFDDLSETSLLVVVKNEQKAIDRDTVERIDAREPGKRTKPVVENKVERGINQPERAAAPPRSLRESPPGAPTMSSSSNVTFSGGKPGFETVYRRQPAPAKP